MKTLNPFYPVRIIRTAGYMAWTLLLTAPGLLAQTLPGKGSGGPLHPLQANMDIRHYTLRLAVDIAGHSIGGEVEVAVRLAAPADTVLLDLVNDYTVRGIQVDNRNATFSHSNEALKIFTGSTLQAGQHTLKVRYDGHPPVAKMPPWQGGFSWKADSLGNPWVVINCQLEGAKVYFPCKDHPGDEPNEGVDMFITIPDTLVVAGPGLLQSVKKNKRERTATWHWKTNYTISNYCVLFNIAKYIVVKDTYTTIDGHTVPVEFYVTGKNKDKALQVIAMRKRDTRLLEKYFGEYPWVKEKIGIAEVPNYGMEHQTMITYGGENFRFTEYPRFSFSGNLFHEFTHEWFANKVTNKDWAHFWIQEGITTYADALFFRDMLGEQGYDSVMLAKRAGIDNTVPLVQGEGLSTTRAYNGDIYDKGAFLMHTLRYLLGDSLFFPALKALSTNIHYPYDTFLISNDIERHFSRHAQQDLKPIFDLYLYTNKTLDFHVRRLGPASYAVYAENLPVPLPVEIETAAGRQKHTISNMDPNNPRQTVIQVRSNTLPVIDPGNWFFKRVIYD